MVCYYACFLEKNKQIYIITSNYNKNGNSEYIKVFDLGGDKIKEINDSNEDTYCINNYYDKKLSKNYIISGNYGYIKSFDYNNNKLYHKYNDKGRGSVHSIIIRNMKDILKIIESCYDGFIRIWNFHSGLLLTKIKCFIPLFGITLWNDNYLFAGCSDNSIKLIDLEKKLIIKSLKSHSNKVLTVKKIIHPKYGECIISQNWEYSSILIHLNKSIYTKNKFI